MSIVKVGVLRGGPSQEYEVSLKNGQHILDMLNSEPLCRGYKGIDIFIDKRGIWHIDGAPQSQAAALQKVDVIFNATKGSFEKDGVQNGGDGNGGKLQRILETFSMPFVGTTSYGSAIALNKGLAKEHFKKHGIKTPYYKEFNVAHDENVEPIARDLFRSFPMPVVVKPRGLGSSLGVSYASNMIQLEEAIKHAREFSNDILVEEYLTGKEIISGFIDDFRGQEVYPIFPVEVKPHVRRGEDGKSEEGEAGSGNIGEAEKPLAGEMPRNAQNKVHKGIFDWSSKQAGTYDHHSPAHLTESEKRQIEQAVLSGRNALGLRHFATADFIVHPRRGVYLLEINTEPSLHEHSAIYRALEAGGIKKHELIEHLIKLALGGK